MNKGIERCNADNDKRAKIPLGNGDHGQVAAQIHRTTIMTQPATIDAGTAYNRVPKVTAYFWLIKLMAVTMGETAADYLAVNMGLGLTRTSLIMSAVLVVALVLQFAQKRYVPWALLVRRCAYQRRRDAGDRQSCRQFRRQARNDDDLFQRRPGRYFRGLVCERATLSIHTILTTKREAFYWLAILFTFALGTAAGDWWPKGSKSDISPRGCFSGPSSQ